jgi:hypothetical protein
MKLETQYLWRDTSVPTRGNKSNVGITWMADTPAWRRPGHEPVLETARQVMVRDQPCEWDYMYGRTSTSLTADRQVWPAALTYPKCCEEDTGACPLPGPAAIYSVSQVGEVWTVTARGSDEARLVYEGPGPVYVVPQ